MDMGLYIGSGCLVIVGMFFVLFPLKTKEKISSDSNEYLLTLEYLEIIVGIYYIFLSFFFAYILYMEPFILKFINPGKETMLSIPVFLLRHFCLSYYFCIGIALILMGMITMFFHKKVKQIMIACSKRGWRVYGLLFIGFGAFSIMIFHILIYIGYLQKLLMR